MSSPDRLLRNGLPRLALLCLLALPLSACLRPLYGPTASGISASEALASIEVSPIIDKLGQERFTHYLRSELIFQLNGSGTDSPKRYRLQLSANQTLQSPIVNTATGRADSAILSGTVDYVLLPLGEGPAIAQGKAIGQASYDRNPQRFNTVRAARDAEIRLAKVLAEQIRTRLAVTLSGR